MLRILSVSIVLTGGPSATLVSKLQWRVLMAIVVTVLPITVWMLLYGIVGCNGRIDDVGRNTVCSDDREVAGIDCIISW